MRGAGPSRAGAHIDSRWALVAVILISTAILATATSASAQVPNPPQCGPVIFSFTSGDPMPAPGSSYTISGTVTNSNAQFQGTWNATVGPYPAGWSKPTITPAGGTLAAGASGSFTLAGSVPATATSAGQISVTVNLYCVNSIISQGPAVSTASKTITVTPTTSSNWYDPLVPYLPAIGGVILLALIIGGTVSLVRRRRAGLSFDMPEPLKGVRPGRGVSFPMVIENRYGQPDTATFEVGPVPDGWSAFTALPELALAPGEKRTVWVMVRAPQDASEGMRAKVSVGVKSKNTGGEATLKTVTAEVQKAAPESIEGSAPAGTGVSP
ncbi:MAG: COG1470 family protein [Thermoplasmatota archaeon]